MAYQLYEAVSPSGKRYFGITSKSLAVRRSWHLTDARANRFDIPFHKALRKYGNAIAFRTLVVGERDYILDLEARAIEGYQTRDRRYGYNVRIGGNAAPTLTPEIAAKVSSSKRGKPVSVGSRAALDFGRTPESRAKAAASNAGRKRSPEFCARMKESALRRGGWKSAGRIWVNNGSVNRTILPNEAIPDGFMVGKIVRRSWTSPQKAAFSAACTRAWIGRRERYPKKPTKWALAGMSKTTFYRKLRDASPKEN